MYCTAQTGWKVIYKVTCCTFWRSCYIKNDYSQIIRMVIILISILRASITEMLLTDGILLLFFPSSRFIFIISMYVGTCNYGIWRPQYLSEVRRIRGKLFWVYGNLICLRCTKCVQFSLLLFNFVSAIRVRQVRRGERFTTTFKVIKIKFLERTFNVKLVYKR